MKENTIKAALAAALGALCAYGVQLLVPVLVLVVVMLLDYATGMAKAWNAGVLSTFSAKPGGNQAPGPQWPTHSPGWTAAR